MGLPNYAYCLMVAVILVLFLAFPGSNENYPEHQPDLQNETGAVASGITRDLSGSAASFEENPFLSQNCVNMLTEFSSKPNTEIKSAIAIVVVKDVNPEIFLKTVNYIIEHFFDF
jgi:hypothetical protein